MPLVTRNELMELKQALSEIEKKSDLPVKFAYGIGRNLSKIENEMKLVFKVRDGFNNSEAIQAFNKDRIETCNMYCDKNVKGDPVMLPGNKFAGLEDNEEFEAAIKMLREKHKETLARGEDINEQMIEMMEEEIEFEFFKIKLDNFPEKGISPSLMTTLIGTIIQEE